ncbi:GNAT family protein [Streptomyces sp. NPDC050738]|uniref:GNAT family N-acetyltransferase n=1 Tax=Streptomyces sp. NPDC050738 TaxID=3154744 RepID=UPI00341491B4
MMRGEKVELRARHESDFPVFQAELYNDVQTRARSEGSPWRPVSPTPPKEPDEPSEKAVVFSVVERETQKLIGEAVLWGIDNHNRAAHLGISMLPSAQGQGFGTDVVRVLCEYGFAVRGLNRLQVETLADNDAMLGAAKRAGFTVDGTLRKSAWVYGTFADEVLLGLLVEDWKPASHV